MAQVGKLSVVLSAKIQKFRAEMTRAEKHVIAFQQKITKLDASVKKFSKVAAAGFAVGGVIGIKKAVDSFADFEKGMVRVGAVSNTIGTPAFESMKASARELAAQTEFSAGQVANAMGFMAQAGFNANQILGATPAVLQLASAAQLDVARAADITTNIMSGFGLQVKDLAMVNDTLVSAMTGANVNLTQLGESFKFAGPVAKGAGLDFKEVAAAFGLMGNAGLQASMAGTGLRGAISRLLNPSKEQAEVMKRFGLNTLIAGGQIEKTSKDQIGGLVGIIQKLEKGGANTADMMKLFGQRAGPAMAVLVAQGSDELAKFTERLERAQGVARRIAEEQLKTLSGQFKILKSGVEEAKISLGEGLVPALTAVIPWLKKAAEFAAFLFKSLSAIEFDPGKAFKEGGFFGLLANPIGLTVNMDRFVEADAQIGDLNDTAQRLSKTLNDLKARRVRLLEENPSNMAEQLKKVDGAIARIKSKLKDTQAITAGYVKETNKGKKNTEDAADAAGDMAAKWEKIRKAAERFSQLAKSAGEKFQLAAAGGEKEKAVISLGFGAKRELDELAKSFKEGRLKNDALSLATDDVREKVIIGLEKMLASAKTLGEMDQVFAGLATMSGVLTSEQKDELFARRKQFEMMLKARGIAAKLSGTQEKLSSEQDHLADATDGATKKLKELANEGLFKPEEISAQFLELLGDSLGKDQANAIAGIFTDVLGGNLGGAIQKSSAGIGAIIGHSLGGVFEKLDAKFDILGTINDKIVKMFEGTAIGGQVADTIGSLFSSMEGAFGDIGAAIGGSLSSVISSAASTVVPMIGDAISGVISTALEVLSGAFAQVGSFVKESFGDLFSDTRIESAVGSFAAFMGALGLLLSAFIGAVTVITAGILTIPAIMLSAVLLFGGALIGVAGTLFQLARNTESFARFQDAVKASFDKLITALEPLFDKMMPLVGLLAMTTEAFSVLLDTLMNMFGLGFMFDVFKQIAIAGVKTAIALGHLINFLAEGTFQIANVFGSLVDAADKLSAHFELFSLNIVRQIEILTGTATAESTQAFAEATAALATRLGSTTSETGDAIRSFGEQARANSVDMGRLSEILQELHGLSQAEARIKAEELLASQELNESLTNIPQGFKVAQARFRAIGVGEGGSPFGGATMSQVGTTIGTQNIVINVQTDADNLESLVADIEAARETNNELTFGTSLSTAIQGNGSSS